MLFPLTFWEPSGTTFWDISLWLAVTAIILLATSELVSPHSHHTTDKKA